MTLRKQEGAMMSVLNQSVFSHSRRTQHVFSADKEWLFLVVW